MSFTLVSATTEWTSAYERSRGITYNWEALLFVREDDANLYVIMRSRGEIEGCYVEIISPVQDRKNAGTSHLAMHLIEEYFGTHRRLLFTGRPEYLPITMTDELWNQVKLNPAPYFMEVLL